MFKMKDKLFEPYLDDLKIIWDALVRRDHLPEKADAILVGGFQDTGLAKCAADLYRSKVSDLIVISGFKPENALTTEAQLLKKACMGYGIPSKKIILEEKASNTGENITFSAEILREKLPMSSTVILVHIPFMSLRFLATAEAQWPKPQPKLFTTCENISFIEYCKKHGLANTAWEMLGDYKRMEEYARKGFQTPQPISRTSKEAFLRITNSGISMR